MFTNKPYAQLWLIIPLILITSFLSKNDTIDLQIHDTYFVFNYFLIGIILSLILGVSGFLYWLLRNKKLIPLLTKIHLVSMIIFSFLMVSTMFLSTHFVMTGDIERYRASMNTWIIVLLLIILSNILFFLNLVIGLFKNQPIK